MLDSPALLLIALVVAAPIAAIVWAVKTHGRIRDLAARLEEMERLAGSRTQPAPVAGQTSGASGHGSPGAVPEPLAEESRRDVAVTLDAPPPMLPPAAEPIESTALPPELPPKTAAAPSALSQSPQETPAPGPPRKVNWEQFMGVKLAAWLGGLALFLALAYLIQYSFEHDLVPPAVRVGVGFVAGLALFAGGIQVTQRRYAVTGQTLSATGVVTLYAITFAAHAVYRFPAFNTVVTMGLMVLVTAAAFILANAQRAQVIAILGMLGGFLTPVVVSTGRDNPAGLFLYLAMLDLGLIAIAARRNWTHLMLLGAIGTAVLQVAWFGIHFNPSKLPVLVTVACGFVVLFGAAHARLARLAVRRDWPAWAALVPVFAAFGFTVALVTTPETALRPGWVFPLLLVADAGALVALVLAADGVASRFHALAGLAAFYVLGLWLANGHAETHLGWAIGAILVFAALHSAAPFIRHRLGHEAPEFPWAGVFPLVGLVALLPVALGGALTSPWVWPASAVLVLLALLRAMATQSLAPLALVLAGSLALLVAAFTRFAPGAGSPVLEVVLAVLTGAGFAAAALAVTRRIRSEDPDPAAALPAWAAHFPGVSATAPFVLLLFLVTRVRLDSVAPVFLASLALALLLIGIGARQRRGSPAVAAIAGVLLVEHAVHFGRILGVVPGERLAWHLGFAALFLVCPLIFRARMLPLQGAVAAAAVAFPGHLFLIVNTVGFALPAIEPGVAAVVLAIPVAMALWIVARTVPPDAPWRLNRLAWLGASVLFCLTVAIPLQYSRQWMTLGWALEGAALIALFRRLPHPGLRVAGVAVLCLVFARLVLNKQVLNYGVRGDWPVWNWILAVYGTATLACFAGAVWTRPPDARVLGIPVRPLLVTLGTVLAFALLNLQIADFFTPWGRPLEFSFSGNFARDMAYTIGWALFALLLLLAGIRLRARHARYASLTLLGAALVKLFFHDLAQLNQLYRIGALAGVAVVAILSSWIYQRFLRTDGSG